MQSAHAAGNGGGVGGVGGVGGAGGVKNGTAFTAYHAPIEGVVTPGTLNRNTVHSGSV